MAINRRSIRNAGLWCGGLISVTLWVVRSALIVPQRPMGVCITNSPSSVYYNHTLIRKTVEELDQAGFKAIYPNV